MVEKEYKILLESPARIYLSKKACCEDLIPMSLLPNLDTKTLEIVDGYGQDILRYEGNPKDKKLEISHNTLYTQCEEQGNLDVLVNNLIATSNLLNEQVEVYHLRAEKSALKLKELDIKKKGIIKSIQNSEKEETEDLREKISILEKERELIRNKQRAFAYTKDLFDETGTAISSFF